MKLTKLVTLLVLPISLSLIENNSITNTKDIIVPIDTNNVTSIEIANRINADSKYGNVIAKDSIKLGEYDIELYVEFENPANAVNEFKKEFIDVFDYLDSTYNLNNATFDEYYAYFLESLNNQSTPYYNNFYIENEFGEFYDIYENTDKNNEIANLLENIDYTVTLNAENDINDESFNTELFELASLIPNYNELSIKSNKYSLSNNSNNISILSLSGTALANAITYAGNYATSPNLSTYAYLSADCTNFASQIYIAAGKSQVVSNNPNIGWWHKLTIISGTNYEPDQVIHSHSNSWIRADAFVDYFGSTGKYGTIGDLSNNLRKGDFIAEDKKGEGDYNHIGFVTAINSTAATYIDENDVQRTYKNFKVAQHSRNYHAYVSSSTNGWEHFDTNENVTIVGR